VKKNTNESLPRSVTTPLLLYQTLLVNPFATQPSA